jgi:hypothetical protein
MGRFWAALAAGLALSATVAHAAGAKTFQPGDVRACGPVVCVVIRSQPVLDALSRFYYGEPTGPAAASAPPDHSPYLRLLYSDGYVTGIVAGPQFGRFLSFGVHTGYFRARTWYTVPRRVAGELRLLASKLSPQPLPGNILSRSH